MSTCVFLISGVEESLKTYLVPESSDSVELYFFDCSGKDSLFSKNEQFWQNCCIVVAVFDLSSLQSLRNVCKWVDRAQQKAGDLSPTVVLVGNKKDLDNDNYNTPERAAEVDTICQKYSAKYFEVSAKENTKLEEPFKHITQLYHEQFLNRVAFLASS